MASLSHSAIAAPQPSFPLRRPFVKNDSRLKKNDLACPKKSPARPQLCDPRGWAPAPAGDAKPRPSGWPGGYPLRPLPGRLFFLDAPEREIACGFPESR